MAAYFEALHDHVKINVLSDKNRLNRNEVSSPDRSV